MGCRGEGDDCPTEGPVWEKFLTSGRVGVRGRKLSSYVIQDIMSDKSFSLCSHLSFIQTDLFLSFSAFISTALMFLLQKVDKQSFLLESVCESQGKLLVLLLFLLLSSSLLECSAICLCKGCFTGLF